MEPNNSVVKYDPSSTPESLSWFEFHNGCAAGLKLSDRRIASSWLLYNKPETSTAQHAGLVLALGLLSHLKYMPSWQMFTYLQEKHELTTMSMLVGLGVSFYGTCDEAVTKLVVIHIPALVKSNSDDLNLSATIQSSAFIGLLENILNSLLGLGFLYAGSSNQRMINLLTDEIVKLSSETHITSIGISLGFIMLGQGDSANVSCRAKLFKCLHGGVFDGSKINTHCTGIAACFALGLMFMKTNDRSVIEKLEIPNSKLLLESYRPDVIMMMVVARHLVAWNGDLSDDWIHSDFMNSFEDGLCYRARHAMFAGRCMSLGLIYAGTWNTRASDLTSTVLDAFLKEYLAQPSTFEGSLNKANLIMCISSAIISTAMIMTSSGSEVFADKIREVKMIFDDYGINMTLNSAMGLLFIGSCGKTIDNSVKSVASLLCAFYPRLSYQ